MASPNEQTCDALLVGVGNEFRCDDGVGVIIARAIHREHPNQPILEAPGEGAALMEAWSDFDRVVLVDAVRSNSDPGRVFRLEAHRERIPSEFFHYSTHAFSVAEAVEMSRMLGTLPASLILYGIEGKNFSGGTELSVEVEDAMKEVTSAILSDLSLGASLES